MAEETDTKNHYESFEQYVEKQSWPFRSYYNDSLTQLKENEGKLIVHTEQGIYLIDAMAPIGDVGDSTPKNFKTYRLNTNNNEFEEVDIEYSLSNGEGQTNSKNNSPHPQEILQLHEKIKNDGAKALLEKQSQQRPSLLNAIGASDPGFLWGPGGLIAVGAMLALTVAGPVGWTLLGIGAAAGIGYGVYAGIKLYNMKKRNSEDIYLLHIKMQMSCKSISNML